MKFIIIGHKGVGKSTIGNQLKNLTGIPVLETDTLIEKLHEEKDGHYLTCRDIFGEHGESFFRDLEQEVVRQIADKHWQFIITGGSIMMNPDNRRLLREDGLVIYLNADPEILWQRAQFGKVPSWLPGYSSKENFLRQTGFRDEIYYPLSDIALNTSTGSPEELAEELINKIKEELAIKSHSANTYGDVIHMTTFGESHGQAIGAVLDGVKPGLELTEEDIQIQLNRRRPGQSEVTTPRSEKDRIEILSGVFDGKTTGAPIAMVIFNRDQDSSKYEAIKGLFRPGHADFTFYKKYGHFDYRGGGRSSGRETAARVMCGAVANKTLAQRGVKITAHALEIAGIKAQTCQYDTIEKNPVRCADPEAAIEMEKAILAARDDNDSVGGVVKLEITGVPVGLGDPVFDKLDARLARAIMSLGAVKGFEIGRGFELARLRGSQSNDNMTDGAFVTNNAGGITGGISTGQPIEIRVAVKPTSSIASPQKTIDAKGENHMIEVHGRHDPCIVPRVIPVLENLVALVILDAWEVQSRLNPNWLD
ncbi:MAG: chorismate synthase [Phycisphaerae bacterium]|nr:chorismate synthase [Phycisphaerae bacterium]